MYQFSSPDSKTIRREQTNKIQMFSLRHCRQLAMFQTWKLKKPPPMMNTTDHNQNTDTDNLPAHHDYQFDNRNSQGN